MFSCPVSFETNFKANNAVVDVSMKLDLGWHETLVMLFVYSETLADNVTKQENEEDFCLLWLHKKVIEIFQKGIMEEKIHAF